MSNHDFIPVPSIGTLSMEQNALAEINAACQRIHDGTFGICEIAGKPISESRLRVAPWARYGAEVTERLKLRHLADPRFADGLEPPFHSRTPKNQLVMNAILDFKKPLFKPLVCIPARDIKLYGELEIPPNPLGLVLFAHGSGSNRHSPRNQSVARVIRNAGIGTLLFDLLTNEEREEDALTNEFRFDVELLAERLLAATRWAGSQDETRGLKIGYFGASTGGGAAMLAASIASHRIAAVVSGAGARTWPAPPCATCRPRHC